MNEIITGFSQTLRGHYKIGIVNVTTDEVEWKESGSNLILNVGMDNLYNMTVADQMTYGISGTGTRPSNQFDVTAFISQSGNLVYLSTPGTTVTDFTSSFNAYPALAQVGDMISCSNGQQLIIDTVNSNGFNLTVHPAYTFSPQNFAVYKTTQTGMQTEVSRSGPGIGGTQYLVGAGNCGTTVNGSTLTHLRTFDFAPVISNQNYSEVGVGWANSGASNIFSRILLTNPITVYAGFKLRLVYQLSVTYGPTNLVSGSVSIGGWPISPSTNTYGTQSIQNFMYSYIDTSGNSINYPAVLDPSYINSGVGIYPGIFASSNTSSLLSFGNAVDRTTTAIQSTAPMTLASYTNGNYYCDKTGIIPAGTSLNIGSIGLGLAGGYYLIGNFNPYSSTAQAYTIVFNQTQSLLNTQALSLTFRYSWGRILG